MAIITAAICTYNRYPLLTKAIESLEKQTLDPDQYQILIVDNSPDWDYAAEIAKKYEDSPLINYVIEKTPGLSNARNVAAKICNTELIAYLDDDAIASPGWLENIVKAFNIFGQDAAIVGGKVDPLWESERPDWLNDDLLCYVSVIDWGGDLRIAQDNEWFAGANIAFRTQDILECGGFDVALGRNGGGSVLLSNEEVGVLELLKQKGKLAVYAPEASVDHLVDNKRLNQAWFRQRIAWQSVSDYMLDPKTALANAQSSWNYVLEYFFGLPPKNRTIIGLYKEANGSQKFQEQLWALSTITTMMMAGFDGVEN